MCLCKNLKAVAFSKNIVMALVQELTKEFMEGTIRDAVDVMEIAHVHKRQCQIKRFAFEVRACESEIFSISSLLCRDSNVSVSVQFFLLNDSISIYILFTIHSSI